MTTGTQIRPLRPSDYEIVIAIIDEWWGGRHMADMLPRLFFEHFSDTSFAVEQDGSLVGFLVGFLSQSRPAEAYIHFVGVHPEHRGQRLGQRMYECFFQVARIHGRTIVRAVTSPVNTGSIAFHARMGFLVESGQAARDGVQIAPGYDGAGQDRVRFVKYLPESRAIDQ